MIAPMHLSVLVLAASAALLAAGALADTTRDAADDWPWAGHHIPPSDLATCIPTQRTDWAQSYHEAMLLREPRENARVVFLGDSITMMWRSQSGYEGGTPVWEEYYAPLGAANLGISGDKTEHVLWRISGGGDLEGLNPKVLVLLIGINNLLQGSTPEDTAAGITTIVNCLRAKLPDTRILLLGVFPCWEKADDPIRERVRRTNAIISRLADRERAFYLDIGDRFVEPDCTIKREKLRDLLHLSEFGYRIWAEAMQGHLLDLLENQGKGAMWGVGYNPMPVGVDEAGSERWITDDPVAQAAFEEIGFDFVMHHFWGQPTLEHIEKLDQWAARGGHGFFINQENSPAGRAPGDPALYRKPGGFFAPPEAYVRRCLESPHFLGFCYDECEHWICNGAHVTGGGPFMPHFHDAEGGTLQDAYEGNLHNIGVLMQRVYPGFADRARQPGATPIISTENVFPTLHHLFARCGMVQMPKLLKETITPVTLAMAMGAAKQYGVRHWTSVDLWGPGGYPGHSPDELRSALLIAYWTGSEGTYIENFSYKGSLYTAEDSRVTLSDYGKVAREFIREYLPANPRSLRFEEFAPEVILVRFPDSDWGQENPGHWIRRNLYGASNLVPDADTRYWLKVWHVISHGTIPPVAVNYNTPLGIPYRPLFPANNVAVYDHLAADPELYRSARLVFLVGKRVSAECLATLRALSEQGLTVVSTRGLAPPELRNVGEHGFAVHPTGAGRWVVTDDVTLPAVRELLGQYLGRPDELRYVFGATEVVFTTPQDPARVEVSVRGISDRAAGPVH